MKAKKKMATIALALVLALAAAGVAKANWEIEGKSIVNGFSESVTMAAEGTYDIAYVWSGHEYTLTATGMSCSSCLINQSGTAEIFDGTFSFTGVTFDKPGGCSIPGGTITTKPLKGELIMDPEGGAATFIKFTPTVGETFMEFPVSGETCLAGGLKFIVKGSLAGRFSETGASAAAQPIAFSAAEEATAGASLKVGEPMTITGKSLIKLSGANAGKSWEGK